MKNCGSCKWLEVPAEDMTKQLRPHKRYDYRAYFCRVPFVIPEFPASIRKVQINDDPHFRMSCPVYGDKCAFHEPRVAKQVSGTVQETPATGTVK